MKFIIFLVLFFLGEAKATVKVAIIDAFFCQNQTHKSKIQIKRILDTTDEKNPFGDKCENTRQFHGNNVLKTIISFYSGRDNIEFYLYKVFRKDGSQDSGALKKALNEISKENIDLIIMAIGFIDHKNLPLTLPAITFVSSGSSGNGINQNDMLWPQMLESKNLFLFAHYFESKSGSKMHPDKGLQGHIDPSLMYLNKVNFLVSSPANPSFLSGSSYAVAKASGIILSRCSSLRELQKCLQKESKPMTILNSTLSKKFTVIQ